MNEKLRDWMEAHGLSNTQLAERLDVSRNLVWRFASGEREITDSFKWRFGKVFGFEEAAAIFDDMPQMEPEQA